MPFTDDRAPLLFERDRLLVCFKSIAQGDQLGVEIACCAHTGLLEDAGLLGESSRLCSNRPFKGVTEAQGLVIDDFFSVCVHDLKSASQPACLDHLRTAKDTYLQKGLLGSDEKDIKGTDFAKIAGAELNSTPYARARGLVPWGAPSPKRIALAIVSAEVARLSHTTDCLHLSLLGSWTSVLLFRRPLMAVLASAFSLVNASETDVRRPVLVQLPRTVAEELTVLSVLCPLASTDLAAVMDSTLYASDASEKKGAFVTSNAGETVTRPLWRMASKKGGYSRLLSKEEAVLSRFTDRLSSLKFAEAPAGSLTLWVC